VRRGNERRKKERRGGKERERGKNEREKRGERRGKRGERMRERRARERERGDAKDSAKFVWNQINALSVSLAKMFSLPRSPFFALFVDKLFGEGGQTGRGRERKRGKEAQNEDKTKSRETKEREKRPFKSIQNSLQLFGWRT